MESHQHVLKNCVISFSNWVLKITWFNTKPWIYMYQLKLIRTSGFQILLIFVCEPYYIPTPCVLAKRFYHYPSGLLHWHWGNHMIAPVYVK